MGGSPLSSPRQGIGEKAQPTLPWENPPDQLSTISLLLLVDPEVTDIERRAMETSL